MGERAVRTSVLALPLIPTIDIEVPHLGPLAWQKVETIRNTSKWRQSQQLHWFFFIRIVFFEVSLVLILRNWKNEPQNILPIFLDFDEIWSLHGKWVKIKGQEQKLSLNRFLLKKKSVIPSKSKKRILEEYFEVQFSNF